MSLLREYLLNAFRYKEENILTRFIGDRSMLEESLVSLMEDVEKDSENATGMILNIAVNYGGRAELVNAVKNLSKKGVLLDGINESDIDEQLYTAGQPDIDLLIRPSGENRISNFLIWQSAYAELVFMDVLWPDFKEADLEEAILEYSRRNRRFGGI